MTGINGYGATRYEKTVGSFHITIERDPGTKTWSATILSSGLKIDGSVPMATPGEAMDWAEDRLANP